MRWCNCFWCCNESNQRCISSANRFFLTKSWILHITPRMSHQTSEAKNDCNKKKKKQTRVVNTLYEGCSTTSDFLYDKLEEYNKIGSPHSQDSHYGNLFLIYTLYSESAEVLKCTHSPRGVCRCAIDLFHPARCSSM